MNSPKLWDKLLQQVPKGSALMGGAVIDYFLNLPVNDYDIFYTYKFGQNMIFPGNWKLTEADFNDEVWIKEHEEAYLQGIDEFGNHPILSVLEYLVDGEHKVQLIGVNYDNPLKHMKNFDHSLTLASYNSKGMFISKKAFDSIDNQIIQYVSKNYEIKAVTKSIIRAKKKIAKMLNGPAWELKGFDFEPAPVKIALGAQLAADLDF